MLENQSMNHRFIQTERRTNFVACQLNNLQTNPILLNEISYAKYKEYLDIWIWIRISKLWVIVLKIYIFFGNQRGESSREERLQLI